MSGDAAHTNLGQMLWARAQDDPARPAFVYMEQGETPGTSWSVGDLHLRALAVANALNERGLRGRTALLLYPQGLDFIAAFFGCLYAGVVAVPVSSPGGANLARSLTRLGDVVADAQPALTLCTAAIAADAAALTDEMPAFADMTWLATDTLAAAADTDGAEPRGALDDLAYLQYTSGSTSSPKGVMMTHGNVFANLAIIDAAFTPSPGEHMVSWLPQFHDLGLIYGIVWPLLNGITCHQMAPADFVQRPARWLKALSDYRAVYSGGANFAFDLCVRKTTAEERAGLDLSAWRVALNGAEPIRAASLREFAAAFAEHGFDEAAYSPSYGLAEATLVVTTLPKERKVAYVSVRKASLEQDHRVELAPVADDTTREIVGCGVPFGDTGLAVVDPDRQTRCAALAIGEVWTRGDSVSQGYLNHAAATEESFGGRIAGEDDRRWLRTGDLGFVHEGELFITGRRKDLIIIRGANHYPQDIEATVFDAHDAFRVGCASAFSVTDAEDEEQLVVVQELQPAAVQDYLAATPEAQPAMASAWIAAARHAVAEDHSVHLYGVALIPPRTLPKTTSGKIQRGPCRGLLESGALRPVVADLPFLGTAFDVNPVAVVALETLGARIVAADAAQRTTMIVDYLRSAVAQALHISSEGVGAEDAFLDLGLDSLKAMEVAGNLQRDLRIDATAKDIFEAAAVQALAAWAAPRIGTASPLATTPEADDYEEGAI